LGNVGRPCGIAGQKHRPVDISFPAFNVILNLLKNGHLFKIKLDFYLTGQALET